MGRLLDFSSNKKAAVLNNKDWLFNINYLEFLREFGVHFSVNRMLTAESVKARMEKGLSYLEFNYMLLQAYDFYILSQKEDCFLQMGGDDQWSNMLWGMELIRRKDRKRAFCVTVPLLTTSSGAKMGKTESGAVWLDPELTTPFEFFQFFRNVEDQMVETCLKYYTDLPVSQIADLVKEGGQSLNQAKTVLAFEVTKWVHGEEEAQKAKDAAQALFSGGPGALETVPEHFVTEEQLAQTDNLIDLIVLSGIIPTKSEVRRLIQQGGLVIDGKKVETFDQKVDRSTLASKNGILVKKGKKAYFTLRISPR
jgi:tyrosyl-tRNA synthetase